MGTIKILKRILKNIIVSILIFMMLLNGIVPAVPSITYAAENWVYDYEWGKFTSDFSDEELRDREGKGIHSIITYKVGDRYYPLAELDTMDYSPRCLQPDEYTNYSSEKYGGNNFTTINTLAYLDAIAEGKSPQICVVDLKLSDEQRAAYSTYYDSSSRLTNVGKWLNDAEIRESSQSININLAEAIEYSGTEEEYKNDISKRYATLYGSPSASDTPSVPDTPDTSGGGTGSLLAEVLKVSFGGQSERTIRTENIKTYKNLGNHFFYFTVDTSGTYQIQAYKEDASLVNTYLSIRRIADTEKPKTTGTMGGTLSLAIKEDGSHYTSTEGSTGAQIKDVVLIAENKDEKTGNGTGEKPIYLAYIETNDDELNNYVIKFTKISDNLYEQEGGYLQPYPATTIRNTGTGSASLLQTAISTFILVLADGIMWLVQIIIGDNISIDSILFDRFSQIKLSFFNQDKGKIGLNSLIETSGIRDVLNKFFNIFRNLAILAYIIILIYMAIQILLGTVAERKAKWLDIMGFWIKGVVILFFFPYIMRYTILLNHAIVTYVGKTATGSENVSMPGAAQIETVSGSLSVPPSLGGKKTDTRNDYMSQMRDRAQSQGYIAYAICYLVMVIQMITFLFIYIKRLITIVYLIVIFPLVTITYSLDRVGDGRAQAFDSWFKEFILNVFLQTFQAINYVIVMGIVTSISTSSWLLIMIGISYVLKGEEMLRKLFGQERGGGAGTVTSAIKSAAVVKAYTTIASNTVNRLKNKYGKGGTRDAKLVNRYNSQIQRALKNEANFDSKIFAINNSSERLGGNVRSDINTVFSNSSTGQEMSEALERLRNYSVSGNARDAFNAEVGSLSLSQQKELENLMRQSAAHDAVKGRKALADITVNQQIDIINKRVKGGGRYKKLAEAQGYKTEDMEREYRKNQITSSVKVDNEPDRKIRFKTGKTSGKHKRAVGGASGTTTSRTTSGASRTLGGTTGIPGGSRTSRAAETVGGVGGAGSTSRSSSTGGTASARPDYAPSASTGGSGSRTSSRNARARRRQQTTHSSRELRRTRAIKRVESVREDYLIRATRSINHAEFDSKMASRPPREVASYVSLANSAAVINRANVGDMPLDVVHEAVSTYRRESMRGHEYTAQIAQQCRIDIDDFDNVLAVQTVNNPDRLVGTAEERQKVIDESIRRIKTLAGTQGELRDAILEKLEVPISSLQEGKIPTKSPKDDKSGIVEQEYEVTAQDFEDYARLKKLEYAETRSARVQSEVQNVTEIAGATTGSLASAAFAAGAGSSAKDIIATASAGGTSASTLAGNVTNAGVRLVDTVASAVTHRKENIQALEDSGVREIVEHYRDSSRGKALSEKLQGRGRTIKTDATGKIHIENGDTDMLGKPNVEKKRKKLF